MTIPNLDPETRAILDTIPHEWKPATRTPDDDIARWTAQLTNLVHKVEECITYWKSVDQIPPFKDLELELNKDRVWNHPGLDPIINALAVMHGVGINISHHHSHGRASLSDLMREDRLLCDDRLSIHIRFAPELEPHHQKVVDDLLNHIATPK